MRAARFRMPLDRTLARASEPHDLPSGGQSEAEGYANVAQGGALFAALFVACSQLAPSVVEWAHFASLVLDLEGNNAEMNRHQTAVFTSVLATTC